MPMREIKYRAWDIANKKMLPVCDISFGDDGSARTIVFQAVPKGPYYRGLVHGENGILMQYTGLQDTSGRDIYEGDILLLTLGKHRLEVRWSLLGWRFFNLATQDWQFIYAADIKRLEVLGNRYEQPELLNMGMEEVA